MHALTHTITHRVAGGPPATRTRVRWQPYHSVPPSVSSNTSRSPPLSCLNTPASSVTSSPSHGTPACDTERIRHVLPSSVLQTPKDSQVRDTPKNKYAMGLVDQAVKLLCEIWRPQDIPPVFLTSPRALASVASPTDFTSMNHQIPKKSRNTQLPSPVSPSTQHSPSSPSPVSSPTPAAQTLRRSGQDITTTLGSPGNLVPIRGFVHEVLRRSRTSGNVLQTALCYLEAIRSKVPELVRNLNAADGVTEEVGSTSRIVREEAGSNSEPEIGVSLDSIIHTEDVMDTVRISDNVSPRSATSPDVSWHREVTSSPASTENAKCQGSPFLPLPTLPSPLLCPRRAFLASLILASKFTQDKCYSNRAWAKLAGLPPREIGRCERALGEALEWRLWVGKVPYSCPPSSSSSSSPLPASVKRPIVRSQSESSLPSSTSSGYHLLAQCKISTTALMPRATLCSDRLPSPPFSSTSTDIVDCSLRRRATFPTEAITFVTFESSGATLQTTNETPASLADTMHDLQRPTTAHRDRHTRPHHSCAADADSEQHTAELATTTSSVVLDHPDIPRHSSPLTTPTLSFSPSSTESSSGDHTIQMSSFLDEPMVPSGDLGISGYGMYPWLDTCDGTNSFSRVSPALNGLEPLNSDMHPPAPGMTPWIVGYGTHVPSKVSQPVDVDGTWLSGMEYHSSLNQLVH